MNYPKRLRNGRSGYLAPAEDSSQIVIKIAPDSQRLQELHPFPVWNGKDNRAAFVDKSKKSENVPPTIYQWQVHGCVFADIWIIYRIIC